MIRTFYIINNLDIGGAERHLLQVLPQLKKENIDPTIYTIGYKGELAGDFESAGIRVIGAPFANTLKSMPRIVGRPLLLLLSALRLLVLLWSMRPDIIHFFLPHAYIMGGIISLFAPRAIRIMSRRSLNNYQNRYPKTAKVERKLHSVMDAILGNSRCVCNELKDEGVAANKLGLIYNGLDLDGFQLPKERTDIRESLGIGADTLVFIIVANLIPYKGHEDLLNAFGLIRNDLPDEWCVLCVGRDTGIGESLKRISDTLGINNNILWLGERRDLPDLLSSSDIGLLVSHEEGFSNSVLEGMAFQLPMIVTDVGGNSEAIEHGISGIVVPPKNPTALARSISYFVNDRHTARNMGIAARARIEEHFEIGQCAQHYAALYQALMKGDCRPVQEMIER